MLKFKDLKVGKKYRLSTEFEIDAEDFPLHDILVVAKSRNDSANLLLGYLPKNRERSVLRFLREKKYTLRQICDGKPYDDLKNKNTTLAEDIDESIVIDYRTDKGNLMSDGSVGEMLIVKEIKRSKR